MSASIFDNFVNEESTPYKLGNTEIKSTLIKKIVGMLCMVLAFLLVPALNVLWQLFWDWQ